VLTASEIAVQIRRGEIVWPGEVRGDGLLLRLGSPLQLLADPGHVVDLANQDSIDALYTQTRHGWDEYDLDPGEMALCAAGCPLRLGPAFAAGIASLSHLARVGLAAHVTSPWVMPGWDGHLTLELSNVANLPITVYPGMKIGQISFLQMTTAADNPYGSDGLQSKYQGQWGPTPSRYADNFRT